MPWNLNYPDIKNCPFCRSSHTAIGELPSSGSRHVICFTCGAQGPFSSPKLYDEAPLHISMAKADINAINLWNKAWEELIDE